MVLITAEAAERLADHEALELVFEADLSTSPMITEVSGRGLGLAIVREKTEKLGGRVAIESRVGEGTTIRMTLPLTLATFTRSARRMRAAAVRRAHGAGRARHAIQGAKTF